MNVLIWGFKTIEEIDGAIETLLCTKLPYLFYVLTTGEETIVAQWGRMRGAPVKKIEYGGSRYADLGPEQRLEYLAKRADYLVLKKREGDSYGRRLLMMMKSLGKHGSVFE